MVYIRRSAGVPEHVRSLLIKGTHSSHHLNHSNCQFVIFSRCCPHCSRRPLLQLSARPELPLSNARASGTSAVASTGLVLRVASLAQHAPRSMTGISNVSQELNLLPIPRQLRPSRNSRRPSPLPGRPATRLAAQRRRRAAEAQPVLPRPTVLETPWPTP